MSAADNGDHARSEDQVVMIDAGRKMTDKDVRRCVFAFRDETRDAESVTIAAISTVLSIFICTR